MEGGTMRKTLFVIMLAVPLLLWADETTVGYLGVHLDNLSDAMKKALDLDNGVLVEKVVEESPAEKGGIEVGDVILKIDDNDIKDYGDLKAVVRERPNERVAMRIHRSGKTMTKHIELGEKERMKIELDLDIPDLEELENALVIKKGELEEELENLKEELEGLKLELEALKEDLRKE